MKPVLVLIGLGVLVGGGIAVAKQFSTDTTVMHNGHAYLFYIYPGFNGEQDDLEALGFASVNMQEDRANGRWKVQAIWAGEEGAEILHYEGMTIPEDLGPITRAEPLGPMASPSKIINSMP